MALNLTTKKEGSALAVALEVELNTTTAPELKDLLDKTIPEIENFYSDSLADTPMALCAEKAHLITDKAQKVNDWPKLDVETLKKVHEKIDSGWSVHL